MKNTKIMKMHYILLLIIFGVSILPAHVSAQEKEKEVKIKMIKEKDGERTVLDTIIYVSGDADALDMDELKEILEEEGIEDVDFDFDFDSEDNVKVKVITMDGSGSDHNKMVIIKSGDDEEMMEMETEYIISVDGSEITEEGNIMKMSIDGSGQGVFVTDGGEIHEVKVGDGAFEN